MVDKNENELKELRDRINELEEEMSVSTRNNIYVDDIKKSKRLLLYRYALLLQIKDVRQVRRKIETRIDRINTLKSLGARGRILTKRESEAIKNVQKDVRKREDIVEEYDNKKEIYADKRLAYYGFDDSLKQIFFKHAELFEPFIEVNEKNIFDLKDQLDIGHNIKDNMSNEEILACNEERYGDEIVDFELGISFGDLLSNAEDKKNEIASNETNNNEETIDDKEATKSETKEGNIKTSEEEVLEKLLRLENELIDDEAKDSGVPKFNYNNGYNLYTEQMERIILDSIDDEIADDIAAETKTYTMETKELLEKDYTEDKYRKEDFLDEQNKIVQENINSKKIILNDEDIFNGQSKPKTEKMIRDKLLLKEKLETYINTKGNDMTREYYNNEIRNRDFNESQALDDIDKALNLDLYELGILYMLDKKIYDLKKNEDSDDYTIKVLINKLYQIKMQYKLFPGFCFDDVDEYKPEKIVAEIKKFDDLDTNLDVQEIYRSAIGFTISTSEVKTRYRKMYGLDRNKTIESDTSIEINDDQKEMD